MKATIFAFLSLAALAACGDDSGGDPDGGGIPDASGPADARPRPDADTGQIPRVEPAACKYSVSTELGLAEGSDYECGDLVVREKRDADEGAIRLHFIRIFSSSGSENATIYLDGGPGGNGAGILSYLPYWGTPMLDGLLVDGDFLVIAQRGTSLSQPSLVCDGSCDGLSEIADLPSYNTAFNADDVDDLRATLGYAKLNLYGISYGSRLGLEVLRRHGENVRAAVLGGLVPAQTNWPAEEAASFYGALTALDASCTEDGGCGAAFGDLVAKFISSVENLGDQPLQFDYQGEPVVLTGYTYPRLVHHMMYAKSTYPWLPMIISDVAERRTDRVGDVLGQMIEWFSDSGDMSAGLYYSVVCGEIFNPPDLSAFDIASAGVPTTISDIFVTAFYGTANYCDSWPKGEPIEGLNEPVTSDVRSLISSGALDPITPPRFGEIVASTLTDPEVVVYANSGHGSTLQSECGLQTLIDFLANPTAALDASCAAEVTTEYELPGTATKRAIPFDRIAIELATAPIPPYMRLRRP